MQRVLVLLSGARLEVATNSAVPGRDSPLKAASHVSRSTNESFFQHGLAGAEPSGMRRCLQQSAAVPSRSLTSRAASRSAK